MKPPPEIQQIDQQVGRTMVQPPTSFVENSLRMQLASLAERARVQNIRHHDPASTHGSVNDLRAKVHAWVDAMTPTQRCRSSIGPKRIAIL